MISTVRNWIDRLSFVIEMLLCAHPMGLRVLLGEIAEPSRRDWEEMLDVSHDELGVRIDCTRLDYSPSEWERVDRIEETILYVGGWDRVVDAASAFRLTHQRKWNIFVERYRLEREPDTRAGEELRIGWICEKYGVDYDTVREYRSVVPKWIATDALTGSQMALFGDETGS